MNIGRPGNDRPKCTIDQDDRFIVYHRALFYEPDVLLQFRSETEWWQVWALIRHCDDFVKLMPYSPAKGPKLLKEHRVVRLRFACKYCLMDRIRLVQGRVCRWPHILFIYTRWETKSKKTSWTTSASVRINNGVSILVSDHRNWFSHCSRYERILNDHADPFLVNNGGDFILVHDNAQPHHTLIV